MSPQHYTVWKRNSFGEVLYYVGTVLGDPDYSAMEAFAKHFTSDKAKELANDFSESESTPHYIKMMWWQIRPEITALIHRAQGI